MQTDPDKVDLSDGRTTYTVDHFKIICRFGLILLHFPHPELKQVIGMQVEPDRLDLSDGRAT